MPNSFEIPVEIPEIKDPTILVTINETDHILMSEDEVCALPVGHERIFRIENKHFTIVYTIEVVSVVKNGVLIREKSEYFGNCGHAGCTSVNSIVSFYHRPSVLIPG